MLEGGCLPLHHGSADIWIAAQILAWIEPVRTFPVPRAAFFVVVIALSVSVTTAAPWLRRGGAQRARQNQSGRSQCKECLHVACSPSSGVKNALSACWFCRLDIALPRSRAFAAAGRRHLHPPSTIAERVAAISPGRTCSGSGCDQQVTYATGCSAYKHSRTSESNTWTTT